MNRRTLRQADPIIGDTPIGAMTVGFQWEIWPTKKGRVVARTTFEDGNGYQIEADDADELRHKTEGYLHQINLLNKVYNS